ncbi:TPA: PaaI family thioesterase [Candidatus Acetothermia bacterium]|nr:PaaI family thioesterase [Candidatus Acetothermia bacterium]
MGTGKELPRYPGCFVCGNRKENPLALGLSFVLEDGMVRAPFTPQREHAGYPGIVHGGIITSLLDEASIWAASAAAQAFCVTHSLKVKFLRPARVGEPLTVLAQMEGRQGRLLLVRARVETGEGQVLAQSQGSFLPRFRREWIRLVGPSERRGCHGAQGGEDRKAG